MRLKPPIHVWRTECLDPSLVLCVQHERRAVSIGYNRAGSRAIPAVNEWVLGEPELRDLYEHAYRLYDENLRRKPADDLVPSVSILLRLNETRPVLAWSVGDDRENLDPLLVWIDSSPEHGDLVRRALSLADIENVEDD